MTKPGLLTRELQFLWLLRGDVREQLRRATAGEDEAHKEFIVWWLLFGRKEYPQAASFPAEYVTMVTEVVATFGELKITRLMRFLFAFRDDVRQPGAGGIEEEWSRFIRWYFARAVPEHDLFGLLSETELTYLQAPAPELVQDATLPLTRLMYWVWLCRPDVGAAFPLSDRESRERFLAWFHVFGLKEGRLFGYISLAHAVRLYEPVPLFDASLNPPITRLMWYLWLVDGQVHGQVDLNTPGGRHGLKQAVEARLRSQDDFRPLWDLLNSVGPLASGRAIGAAEPVPPTGRPSRKPKLVNGTLGVNLVGYALGELGIGEDVRMLAQALEAVGLEFCILNRQPGPSIRQMDFSVVRHFAPEPRYPITVVCMTAFDTATLWLERPDLFQNTHVIGFWPWELPQWPEQWDGIYGVIDEIWCSSQYTRAAFAPRSPVPVVHMPMAVTVESVTPCSRARFGLPEDRFLFLFVFDFMSYPARKNPEACIQAFRAAFPQGDEPVNLLLKVSNVVPDSPQWRRIEAECALDPRILVMNVNLDRGMVLGLMDICDAYLSLHRAEGFGRTLAEAMLLKKPVIATGYSGNADFLNDATGYPVDYTLVDIGKDDYPCGEGQVWAEPDAASAVSRMREVVQFRERARERGGAAQDYIRSNHAPQAVGYKVRKRLAEFVASRA